MLEVEWWNPDPGDSENLGKRIKVKCAITNPNNDVLPGKNVRVRVEMDCQNNEGEWNPVNINVDSNQIEFTLE